MKILGWLRYCCLWLGCGLRPGDELELSVLWDHLPEWFEPRPRRIFSVPFSSFERFPILHARKGHTSAVVRCGPHHVDLGGSRILVRFPVLICSHRVCMIVDWCTLQLCARIFGIGSIVSESLREAQPCES